LALWDCAAHCPTGSSPSGPRRAETSRSSSPGETRSSTGSSCDGDPDPNPVACIVVGETVVGWVDYDHDRTWLDADEVNVGYNVFAAHRGQGHATRAVRLLLQHLAEDTDWRAATLLIHPDNERSLALARRAGFEEAGRVDGDRYWKRPIRSPAAAELGPWSPLEVNQVVRLFSPAGFRWWISGGRALALHVGRSWRPHSDTDIGIQRRDAPDAFALLAGWDLHVAAAGRLTPWRGEPLHADRHENNVWCRPAPGAPWAFDLTIGDGTDRVWVYRRDRSVHLPWDAAVLRTAEGVPYLAPEVQLLFKSTNPRPKDDLDAAVVSPELDRDRQRRLARWLPAGHPWQRHVR